MLSGVVLVLVLLSAGGKDEAQAVPMPSLSLCQQAGDAFVAVEPDAHEIQPKPSALSTRYAHCVTLPAPGKDT